MSKLCNDCIVNPENSDEQTDINASAVDPSSHSEAIFCPSHMNRTGIFAIVVDFVYSFRMTDSGSSGYTRGILHYITIQSTTES